ncbi:hypothetical protein A2U01_0034637, partial [Trifolium medium]|nr:hypothetical protein [Trifolium medium]
TKEGEAATLQHVTFETNCKVLIDVVYGTNCTKFPPPLPMTNFGRGTYGTHKAGSLLPIEFFPYMESGIELLTSYLRDQDPYHFSVKVTC